MWTLTPQILEIGFAALHSMGVDQFVQEALQSLADEFSGIVNLGEKNNNEVIIIARATGSAEQRSLFIMNQRVGNTLPNASSLYQALHAAEDQWSLSRYPEHHVVSVSIPVTRDEPRSLALGISVSIQAFSQARIEQEVIPKLRHARQNIRRLMHLGDI
ncbi:putative transcriptional regulator [Pusillimonas sp. T7-7]|uniref:transcriptional regulator n=1 Tax=Pusillimonas sp. (strain T7-7) TaxID=1007105 RepID=UPI00020856CF|nr:transcriptional regulator [Pusillimonas sp. T7-7]AEC20836.1 putative transcriptional regulator [Pusillimonas sp. T7-7]